MITRAAALVLLLYALGFALFAVTPGRPASPSRTDAIVVLTGGEGRLERGVDLLARGRARRLLVAGADPSVAKADLEQRIGGARRAIRCCLDLGSESVDTRSNAEEALRWVRRNEFRSLRLVTSDWHMRRAGFEFRRELGGDFPLVEDAVEGHPDLSLLLLEYSKYLARRLTSWIDR